MPDDPHERSSRLQRGEIARGIVAGCALAGLFAAAFAIGSNWQAPRETLLAGSAPAQSDDDLTTGSIVFVPDFGSTCRQNLIDNRTWEVRDNGTMPCHEALAAAPHRRSAGTGATRLDIIRESFRKSAP
jgi:hypothetical protein